MKTTQLKSGTRMSAHPIAFSIMRMCGVNPAAAISRTAVWPEEYVPDYVELDRGRLRMRIALDPSHDVLMTVDGQSACISARGRQLPDTALMAVPGLPLGKVVDHVLLTGASHLVRSADDFHPTEEGIGTHFHLDDDAMEYVVP